MNNAVANTGLCSLAYEVERTFLTVKNGCMQSTVVGGNRSETKVGRGRIEDRSVCRCVCNRDKVTEGKRRWGRRRRGRLIVQRHFENLIDGQNTKIREERTEKENHLLVHTGRVHLFAANTAKKTIEESKMRGKEIVA